VKVLVLGAGMMGRAATHDLARAPGITRVYVADVDLRRAENAAALAKSEKVEPLSLDVADRSSLLRAMKMAGTTLAAVSHRVNLALTQAAIETGTHLCDLGGSDAILREQRKLDAQARQRGVAIIPDCGLSPGLVCLMAARGLELLGQADRLEIRVGGLPQHPAPPLFYKLVFSSSGLMNEYLDPCLIVQDGKAREVPPLTELEEVEFPAPFGRLEAFHSAGGLSTMPDSFAGRIASMNSKTLRYPGHCERMKMMLDLGLASEQPVELPGGRRVRPRDVLEKVLERALTNDDEDAVLLRVTMTRREGTPRRLVQQLIDRHDRRTDHTAMMRTTAYPAAIIAHMLASGAITERGVLAQERCVPLEPFFTAIDARGLQIEMTQA
jgi:lysine 6-dehydrogenase